MPTVDFTSDKRLALSKIAVVIALGLAVLAVLLSRAPAIPFLKADSRSYIEFWPIRTATYPLFLRAFGIKAAIVLQPALNAIAITYLGLETLALTGSLTVAAAVMTLTIANPPLLTFHYTILTESLFVSIFTVFLGLVMRLSRHPSPALMTTESAVAGLAVTVRPAGWFFLPLMLIISLMLGKGLTSRMARWSLVACAIVPLLACVGAERALSAYLQTHNPHAIAMPSLLDRALIGKAGVIDAPAGTFDLSTSGRILEYDFAPVRSLIAHAPNWAMGRYLELNYETCLEYACAAALRLDRNFGDARRAALARIVGDPDGFFSLAWREYLSLWTIYTVSDDQEAARDNGYIASHRPLPMEKEVYSLTAKLKPAKWTTKLAQLALFSVAAMTVIASLMGLVAARTPFSPRPINITAMSAALSVQGALALNAIFAVGITRYMVVLWPAMVVFLVCGMWTFLGWACAPKDNVASAVGRGFACRQR